MPRSRPACPRRSGTRETDVPCRACREAGVSSAASRSAVRSRPHRVRRHARPRRAAGVSGGRRPRACSRRSVRRRVQRRRRPAAEHAASAAPFAVGLLGAAPAAPACRRQGQGDLVGRRRARPTRPASADRVGSASTAASAAMVAGSPGPGAATSSGHHAARGVAGDRVEQHAVGVDQRPLPGLPDDRDRHALHHGDDDGVRPAAGDLDRGDLGQPRDPRPAGVDVDPQQRRARRDAGGLRTWSAGSVRTPSTCTGRTPSTRADQQQPADGHQRRDRDRQLHRPAAAAARPAAGAGQRGHRRGRAALGGPPRPAGAVPGRGPVRFTGRRPRSPPRRAAPRAPPGPTIDTSPAPMVTTRSPGRARAASAGAAADQDGSNSTRPAAAGRRRRPGRRSRRAPGPRGRRRRP